MVELAGNVMGMEEAVAHTLNYLNRVAANANDGSGVRDVVLTIPWNANNRQRQALIDAAEISGYFLHIKINRTKTNWNVKRFARAANVCNSIFFLTSFRVKLLAHETSSAALQRSLDFDPAEPEKQLIFNMGARHTEVRMHSIFSEII